MLGTNTPKMLFLKMVTLAAPGSAPALGGPDNSPAATEGSVVMKLLRTRHTTGIIYWATL
jgi:hypothetical protein